MERHPLVALEDELRGRIGDPFLDIHTRLGGDPRDSNNSSAEIPN